MIHLLSLALCLTGFAALALAMERPQHDLLHGGLPARINAVLRLTGSLLLLVALATLVVWQGWALGLVMFSGHTSLAAAVVHLALIAAVRLRSGQTA